MKRQIPGRDFHLHLDEADQARCATCRMRREDLTPEGLLIRKRIDTEPSGDQVEVVEEVGRSNEVLCETRIRGGIYRSDETAAFVARRYRDLLQRQEQMASMLAPTDTLSSAGLKWNVKRLRRRIRRLINEMGTARLEIEDKEARALFRTVAQEQDAEDQSSEEVLPTLHDSLSFLIANHLDPVEFARLHLRIPAIVTGSARSAMWGMLSEALDAFRYSLFRLAIVGCRGVVEDAIETAMIQTGATLGSSDKDCFAAKVGALAVRGRIPTTLRQSLLDVWELGCEAVHNADAPIGEDEALMVLDRTRVILEYLSDSGALGSTDLKDT